MPRWLVAVILTGSVLGAVACDDETVEVVPKEVCYSEMRWVGERRGSPEMFPGRDCVGCHLENDGPPLALGGTIYPYVLGATDPGFQMQTGTDCFGIEGIEIVIEDGEGQQYPVTTNRAGNFYVEGNPDEFAKPFTATINWVNPATGVEQTSQMFTQPSYGGCGRCHNPTAQPYEPDPALGEGPDLQVLPQPRIGLPGYGPGDDGFIEIGEELGVRACQADPTLPRCDRLLEDFEAGELTQQ